MTSAAFLNSHLILRIEKLKYFFLKRFLIILTFEHEKLHIFFWEYATWYWLVNEKKNREKICINFNF